MASTLRKSERWQGEDVTVSEVERVLPRLREEASEPGEAPALRTSVMTHIAWVPHGWIQAARKTLEGMAERHPSRTLLLMPYPDDGDRIDASAYLQSFRLPELNRSVSTEVVELHLHGQTASAPASVVAPLLISDLPVFLRWRGLPAWRSPALEQLVHVADRLIVDSTEWGDELPGAYAGLVEIFPHIAASDIAWARTGRWRALLASLWPGIAEVRSIRVTGTAAQAHLLAGWLRSRLGREIALEHEPAERLEGIALDGEPAPFPPGDPPTASELLSDELERFSRDPVYEAAVAATCASPKPRP